jgi:hypothetical protein
LSFAVPLGPADGCCQDSTFDAASSREPVTTRFKNAKAQNNPLMIRKRHWKSLIVLPMFRLSIIGA